MYSHGFGMYSLRGSLPDISSKGWSEQVLNVLTAYVSRMNCLIIGRLSSISPHMAGAVVGLAAVALCVDIGMACLTFLARPHLNRVEAQPISS